MLNKNQSAANDAATKTPAKKDAAKELKDLLKTA